jgi:hypothetical protein
MEIYGTAAAPITLGSGAWIDFAGTSPSEETLRTATRSMVALAAHYAELANIQRAADERERALRKAAYEPIAKLRGRAAPDPKRYIEMLARKTQEQAFDVSFDASSRHVSRSSDQRFTRC